MLVTMMLKAEDSIQIPADTISGLYCCLYWKMTTIMMKLKNMMETESQETLRTSTSSLIFLLFVDFFWLMNTKISKHISSPSRLCKKGRFWLASAFLNDDNNLVESFCLCRGMKFRKGNCFWQTKLNETKREMKICKRKRSGKQWSSGSV